MIVAVSTARAVASATAHRHSPGSVNDSAPNEAIITGIRLERRGGDTVDDELEPPGGTGHLALLYQRWRR